MKGSGKKESFMGLEKFLTNLQSKWKVPSTTLIFRKLGLPGNGMREISKMTTSMGKVG